MGNIKSIGADTMKPRIMYECQLCEHREALHPGRHWHECGKFGGGMQPVAVVEMGKRAADAIRGICTGAVKLALFLCASSLPAMDWSRYDLQLHAASGALGAYVISDVLECTTELPPWARWLISTGTMTAAGWAYEELNGNGLREANDAHATTIGAMVGATVHGGVSFFLTNDGGAVGYSVRF